MESASSILRSALQFVCGDKTQICRLCFSSTEQTEVSVMDLVTLNKPYLEDSMTILEMLNTLNMPNEPFLPQNLCGECATATINNYLFFMLCQSANKKWSEALDCLKDCLYQTEGISPGTKTVYLTIGECGNSIITTRKAALANKTATVRNLQRLVNKKKHYVETVQTWHTPTIMCTVCGDHFSCKKDLNRHMRNHKNNSECSKLCCPQCCRWFATKLHLQEHAERVHFPKTFPCSQCSRMFGSERMVKRHIALSHQAVVCKLCLLQFPSRKQLRVHSDKHQINKCSECLKQFQNRQVFKLHLKICGKRQRDPAYFCDICKKGYLRKNSLRSHLKTDHGFGKTYNCSWCKKKFDAFSKLRNHIVKHTKERNFYCEHCGDKFVTQAALTYHIRRHTGEKPYACDLCEQTFLSASRRAEHKRRIHIGPQLECTVCHVKFGTKHQLLKHEARHSNPHSKLYVPLALPLHSFIKDIKDFQMISSPK